MTILEKTQFVGTVIKGGAKAQLRQEWTWALAVAVGLHQGLKYKGDLKNGVAGGLAVLMVLACVSGAYNVVSYWDKIKEVLSEKEE